MKHQHDGTDSKRQNQKHGTNKNVVSRNYMRKSRKKEADDDDRGSPMTGAAASRNIIKKNIIIN